MINLLRVDTVSLWTPSVKSTSRITIVTTFNRISTMLLRFFQPLDRLLTRWTTPKNYKVSKGPRIRSSCIKISKKILISTTIASNLHHTLKPCTGTVLRYLTLHSTRIMSNSSKILPPLIHVQLYLKAIIRKCQLNRCLPTCSQNLKNTSLRKIKNHLNAQSRSNPRLYQNKCKNLPNLNRRAPNLTNSDLILRKLSLAKTRELLLWSKIFQTSILNRCSCRPSIANKRTNMTSSICQSTIGTNVTWAMRLSTS